MVGTGHDHQRLVRATDGLEGIFGKVAGVRLFTGDNQRRDGDFTGVAQQRHIHVPEELVADDLERGTLIRVLMRYSHRLAGLYLYYPHRNVSPALRVVVDALKC